MPDHDHRLAPTPAQKRYIRVRPEGTEGNVSIGVAGSRYSPMPHLCVGVSAADRTCESDATSCRGDGNVSDFGSDSGLAAMANLGKSIEPDSTLDQDISPARRSTCQRIDVDVDRSARVANGSVPAVADHRIRALVATAGKRYSPAPGSHDDLISRESLVSVRSVTTVPDLRKGVESGSSIDIDETACTQADVPRICSEAVGSSVPDLGMGIRRRSGV